MHVLIHTNVCLHVCIKMHTFPLGWPGRSNTLVALGTLSIEILASKYHPPRKGPRFLRELTDSKLGQGKYKINQE